MANSNKRYSKSIKNGASDKTIQEAEKIANGIKKPEQSKEQTKLITQGIQKGIELYKKQQKAKARELDKHLKKAKNLMLVPKVDEESIEEASQNSPSNTLPWALLTLSWVGFACFSAFYLANT
jgi:hypothetical protein